MLRSNLVFIPQCVSKVKACFGNAHLREKVLRDLPSRKELVFICIFFIVAVSRISFSGGIPGRIEV
jgi:hypothetical protein